MGCDPQVPMPSLFHFFHKGFEEKFVLQLISLQKANGSWELGENLTKILGTNLGDVKAANPAKVRCKVEERNPCVLHDGRIITGIRMNEGQAEK